MVTVTEYYDYFFFHICSFCLQYNWHRIIAYPLAAQCHQFLIYSRINFIQSTTVVDQIIAGNSSQVISAQLPIVSSCGELALLAFCNRLDQWIAAFSEARSRIREIKLPGRSQSGLMGLSWGTVLEWHYRNERHFSRLPL